MIFARASDSVLSYTSRKSNFEHFCDQNGITALPSGVFLHILKRKIFFLEPGLRTERARENITMKVKYSLVIINDRQVDQLTLILRFKTKEGVIFFSK